MALDPQPLTSCGASSSSRARKRKRQYEQPVLVHPYILKFETREYKIHKILNSLFALADNDLVVSDRETGLNDWSMNLEFARKLDSMAKTLAGFSRRCSEQANVVCDKVNAACDVKRKMQDIVYLEEITKEEDKCAKLRNKKPQPKQWDKRIKEEPEKIPEVYWISSDDGSDEEEEEVTDKKTGKKTVKKTKKQYPRNVDTNFTYAKENNNKLDKFRCEQCGKRFRDSQELRNHQTNHSIEIYKCMRCTTVCRSERSFANHHNTHINGMHACPAPNCGMQFALKSSLTNHLQKHSNQHLKCDCCTKSFKYRQSQLEHIIKYRHREQRTVQCPVCKKLYWTPTSMRSHKAKYHFLARELYREG